ncbi:hypothetical protein LP419_39970 [Massilia sp. H-1]|nr:hypothetical protein LP419_39970 [Massilia sp. H-1]
MATSPIPEDLRRFVLSSIASVPHLEALLLLRSGQGWDAAALAERLYVSDKAAAIVLADLCRDGMCVPDAGGLRYHYQLASPYLA